MLKLHVVQAEYGDCLILEYGQQASPRYILIDGGPTTTYERHLRGLLQQVGASGGKLDLVMLSHVDNDHIIGLLDLMAELRQQRANGEAEIIAIDALWHNAFSQTIGAGTDIEARLQAVMAMAGTRSMNLANMAVQGIGEGHQLRLAATALRIPINPGFVSGFVRLDDASDALPFENLSLRVVGPTQENLDELQHKWLEWLDKHEDAIASADPFLMANADRSVPNLSSIMVLAEADDKTILLTGDGRSDHLLQGLKQAGLLDSKGKMFVNVLKMPHHGSDRNMTKTFFKKVRADQYVFSANGRDGNPDLATLIWLVETANRQRREIEIVVTNKTISTRKLLEEYDPDAFGYKLTVMEAGAHSIVLTLAA
jgi:hypothetical protein